MAWVAVVLQVPSLTVATPPQDVPDPSMGTLEIAVAELTRSQQAFQTTMMEKMEALRGVCQPITTTTTPAAPDNYDEEIRRLEEHYNIKFTDSDKELYRDTKRPKREGEKCGGCECFPVSHMGNCEV